MLEYLNGPSDSYRVYNRYQTFTGELAFEIGANRGWLASVWAGQFDHVVACEPHPGSYQALARDAAKNVTPLNIAVSDHSGTVTLEFHEESERLGELFTAGDKLNGWGAVTGTIEVETLTLNDLTDVYGQPDFIKIDTEGHEIQVLDGGLETFAQGPEFLIEVHSRAKGDAVYMILRKLGLEFEVMRHRSSPIPGSNWYDHYWFLSP